MNSSEKRPQSPLKEDPRQEVRRDWQGAVLLLDEIRYYCEQVPPMIDPFEERYLKPASYHLCLGIKCRVDGKDVELSFDNPKLTIPPHGLAVVSTLERINLPTFLIARWNLKVKLVYYGLVWVGSLQVDPGYQGHLFCPLYNLSTEPVHLRYAEPLFTIDFVRTTRYDEAKGDRPWMSAEGRPTDSFKSLDVVPLRSAPQKQFNEMRGELKAGKENVERFQSRIDSFQAIIFTVLGIIVAALSFVAISEFADLGTAKPSNWQIATWIIVLSAISTLTGVLAFACIRALRRK